MPHEAAGLVRASNTATLKSLEFVLGAAVVGNEDGGEGH